MTKMLSVLGGCYRRGVFVVEFQAVQLVLVRVVLMREKRQFSQHPRELGIVRSRHGHTRRKRQRILQPPVRFRFESSTQWQQKNRIPTKRAKKCFRVGREKYAPYGVRTRDSQLIRLVL